MNEYIVINQAFAIAHNGYQKENMVFTYAVTSDGLYVTSANSIEEFPELFENSPYLYGMPYIELTIEDFPKPPDP